MTDEIPQPEETISQKSEVPKRPPFRTKGVMPVTMEEARRGGQAKSARKTAANRIKPLVTGEQSSDPRIREMVIPTAQEKLMGITTQDKVRMLKKLNPLFASQDSTEFLLGVEEFLGKLVISAYKKEQEGKVTDREFSLLIKHSLDIYDRMYGAPASTTVNINNIDKNVNVTWHDILKKMKDTENSQNEQK